MSKQQTRHPEIEDEQACRAPLVSGSQNIILIYT